jgi:TolB protein
MIKNILLIMQLCLFQNVIAALNIDITQVMESTLPIAIVPFGLEVSGLPVQEDIATIISNNLGRSGRFSVLSISQHPEKITDPKFLNNTKWKELTHYVVIGTVRATGNNYAVTFHLINVVDGQIMLSQSLPSARTDLRKTAHKISDLIYQLLTGEIGIFDSRIAYITTHKTAKGKQYRLQVSDFDGFNAKIIAQGDEPILSPAWSPDGRRLAYVSLENKRMAIYVHDIYSNLRDQVSAHQGLNSSPAWSPDGTKLAMTLSKDGNAEIYVLDLTRKSLQRLTHDPAIDTEPAWSPDGKVIIFTSDRGGKPQIYQMVSKGGSAQRLTFQGNYNARASFSPNGQKIVLINGDNSLFRIAILENGHLHYLSNTAMDKSPSFSPNGSMVMYATQRALAAVSVDGRVRQRINVDAGAEIRESAWSPRSP